MMICLMTLIIQGNNTKAIEALLAPAEKGNKSSFGVQVTFDDVMNVLDDDGKDASIKAIYVELLQGKMSRIQYRYNNLTVVCE